MKELHVQGADLLAVDAHNMSALHHAAKLGSLSMAKYLVENGSNLFFSLQPICKIWLVGFVSQRFNSRKSYGVIKFYLFIKWK